MLHVLLAKIISEKVILDAKSLLKSMNLARSMTKYGQKEAWADGEVDLPSLRMERVKKASAKM